MTHQSFFWGRLNRKTGQPAAAPSDLATDTTPRDLTRIGARIRSATMGRVDGVHP
ncbi:MAG: hypothetical protein QG608_3336 [Actinomycetota bacterium]|nr:hypothetical protein [Actinomycetota bacterium]